MTAPGNDVLLMVLLVALTASTGYAAGRIHQWYRTALERDQAFRDGYDTATRSLFSLAARIVRPRRSEKPAVRGTATVTSILAAPSNSGLTLADAGSPSADPADTGRTHGGRTHAGPTDDEVNAYGRHTVPDELVTGPTYRLAPDRVARAKVPPTAAPTAGRAANADETTAKVRFVPKPRAS